MTKKVITNSEFLDILKTAEFEKVKTNKKVSYYNIPCSFDIESSSFYKPNQLGEDEKVAIMYEWTFAIYGYVTVGRTWEEFMKFYDSIVDILNINMDNRLIVYVHNLSFEFQFMRKLFDWDKIFALSERKPVQAITTDGIEFRCSYKLSGYSLAKLGDQLIKYKVPKMVGDLNYDLIRHSKTPLTEKEWQYCVNDCLVVIAYIQELIEREGNIGNIPLTKTGFVRRYCRHKCLYENDDKYNTKYKKYRNLMKHLTLDVETYEQLKRAFAGGFTHASPLYAMNTVENVKSYDFTSSYPYVMISEKFPMTNFERRELKNKAELNDCIKNYCCLFDIELFDVESKVLYENYISKSHCYGLKNAVINNGRVVSADCLTITITDVDYLIIKKFYKWKKSRIYNFKIAKRGYLPKDFIHAILELYKKKTELKDLDGFEIEYLKAKEDINAMFGMTVTDICRDEIKYGENGWSNSEVDKEKAISRYNKSVKRFLNYAWGVWVTAYARLNLFTGIVEFKNDYLYSDTDSLKVINYEKHEKYINRYNEMVMYKLQQSAIANGFNMEDTRPKNKKGESKQIGVWSDEGVYSKFKSLGAKRYMYEKNGNINLTVSGVNKIKAVPYLLETYGEDIFNAFAENLHIPAEYINSDGKKESGTGKQTHTYIDEPREGYIEDYLGNINFYREESGIHLEPTAYDFSILQEYIDYIFNIKQEIID